MTNRIAADPCIDPRIKAVFVAPDGPPTATAIQALH